MSARMTVKFDTVNRGGIAKFRSGVTFLVTYTDHSGVSVSVYHDASVVSCKEMLAQIGVDIHDALCERVW